MLSRLFPSTDRRPTAHKRPTTRRVTMEQLEDRTMLISVFFYNRRCFYLKIRGQNHPFRQRQLPQSSARAKSSWLAPRLSRPREFQRDLGPAVQRRRHGLTVASAQRVRWPTTFGLGAHWNGVVAYPPKQTGLTGSLKSSRSGYPLMWTQPDRYQPLYFALARSNADGSLDNILNKVVHEEEHNLTAPC